MKLELRSCGAGKELWGRPAFPRRLSVLGIPSSLSFLPCAVSIFCTLHDASPTLSSLLQHGIPRLSAAATGQARRDGSPCGLEHFHQSHQHATQAFCFAPDLTNFFFSPSPSRPHAPLPKNTPLQQTSTTVDTASRRWDTPTIFRVSCPISVSLSLRLWTLDLR